MLLISQKGKIGESYNVGSGKNIKNIDIIKKIIKISKTKSLNKMDKVKIKFVKDRPGHDIRYALNCNKIFKKLGWKSKIPFEKGLSDTFDWYLNNKKFLSQVAEKLYINRLGLKK